MPPCQQNGWLLRVQHTLCVTDKANRQLSKKVKRKSVLKRSKSVKSLRYMDEICSRIMTFHYLKVASYVKYKARNYCKIEAVIQRFSVKKVFFKILQNSQGNPCARVSFLIKLHLRKRIWHRCFPVNIAKFLRTLFL